MRALPCAAIVLILAAACWSQAGNPASRATPPEPAKSPADFLGDWKPWSTKTVKALQDGKVLFGQDLSSTRVVVGTVEANVTRLGRAIKLEDEFDKVDWEATKRFIQQLDALIDRFVKDGVIRTKNKKAAIEELETIKKSVEVRLVALHARKTLLYQLGQDMTSLHTRLRGVIDTSKVETDKKTGFRESVSPLEKVGTACSEAAQRDSEQYDQLHERALRVDEAIALMKSL
jgi:hypothetical protein